jgi:signal transduction histidine kinase
MAVIERQDGSIWVGSNCGGLSRFDGKRFTTYDEKNGLLNSCVWALAEDVNQNLWVGTWGGGAFRFRNGKFERYSRSQGLGSDIVRSIVAAPDGSVWLATEGGLACMRNEHLRVYRTDDGLSSNRILAVYADRHGEILAASSAGIDRLRGEKFVPLSSPHPILDPRFIGFGETQSGERYAFSAPRGISRILGDRLVDTGPDLDVLNMAQFRGQELWFSSGNGIIRLLAPSAGLSPEDRADPLNYTRFGRADGLSSTECSIGSPNIVIDRYNRLWAATVQGLTMIDLLRLPKQRRRPAIFLEEATVDRRMQLLSHQVVLPPGNHHLELKFDVVELTSPQKIRFQYRLDSVDGGWLDAGSTRTAIYTSVPIGTHWFHVRACNSDGVWDREGIAYAIVQQPFLYETKTFRMVAVALLVLLAAGAYRLRMRQVAAGLNARMEERINERMRISRDLHDTLLQSFQGLLLRFHAANNLILERPEEAKRALTVALDQGAEAVAEARSTVENLRDSTVLTNDLARELSCVCDDLRTSGAFPTAATVEVEGQARELHPLLRDEIFRIASEALRNAFRHARARKIRVAITYGDRELQLKVSDDGRGIDREIFDRGERQGHMGLPGMRERAESIGGRLDVWSASGTGTQIVLRLPAMRVYSKSPTRRWRLLGKGKYE